MNERFESITNKKIHHLFTRGFIHYDNYLEKILDNYENNEKFFLYTDFCPIKNSLNLDDMNQFLLLKWLQEVFNVPLIVHVKDNHSLVRDEVNVTNAGDSKEVKQIMSQKYSANQDFNLNANQMKKLVNSIADQKGYVKENFRMSCMEMITTSCIREIIALGLNPQLTFICRNLEYLGHEPAYFECIIRTGSVLTLAHAQHFYNIENTDSIAAVALAAKDVAALFSGSYPTIFDHESNIRCLALPGTSPLLRKPISILSHLVAPILRYPTPSILQLDHVPALQPMGLQQPIATPQFQPMTTLQPLNCIFLSDSDKQIRDKINKVAFSGGQDSVSEHRRLGGNCDVDVSYQYLRYFMADEGRLSEIGQRYKNGEMLTGELKKETIDMLIEMIDGVRRKRSEVSDEVINQFESVRSIGFAPETRSVVGEVSEVMYECEAALLRDISAVTVSEELMTDKKDTSEEEESENKDVVTPWEVIGDVDKGINYDKLIELYGSSKITEDLVNRFETVTGKKAHHLLRRGMFYSHREFNEILDAYEKGQKFFLYTGRGPSSEALHLGHLIPFIFTKWLQDIFDVPLVVQLTDDEKCLMRNIDIKEVQRLAIENAKDIMAIGYDIKKTFIFRDLEYMGQEPAFFQTAFRVGSKVTFNQVKGIFGFSSKDSVEKIAFPATQAAPSFSSSFPAIFGNNTRIRSLIPCAIDQDPYFRMTRDVAPRLDMPKPALIHSRFFPALQGNQTKMNASDPNSAIFMTDSTATIVDKIMNHAFTISADKRQTLTAEEVCQRDICYLYLTFFMEDDDRLESIRQDLVNGQISNEEVKRELIGILVPLVERHALARAAITDETVHTFMRPRALNTQ